jgi:hypothetical protein
MTEKASQEGVISRREFVATGTAAVVGGALAATAIPASATPLTVGSPSISAVQVNSANIIKNIVTDFGAVADGVTDVNPAFDAFNAWAMTYQTSNPGLIQLNLPAGSYLFNRPGGGIGNYFAAGIKELLVMGYGATITDGGISGANGFFLGGRGQWDDNAHSARTVSTSPGDNTITLIQPSQTSLFTVGGWATMTGFDTMGYGAPTNPRFFEYVQITGINPTTGVISLSAALQNVYKSTWPIYNYGDTFHADQGGPATLYAFHSDWDQELEYRGLTVDQLGQTYCGSRSVVFRDVTATNHGGGGGIVPSGNVLHASYNCHYDNCAIEIDKIIDTLIYSGTTVRILAVQSSSVNSLEIDNCNITYSLNGTPISTTISNSTIASLTIGASACGVSESITCSNCTIGAIAGTGTIANLPTDLSATISSGMITVANSLGPFTWAVPGANLCWVNRWQSQGPVFQILDVTQDATNTYIQTSLPNGYPTMTLGGGNYDVKALPVSECTFTNCVGCDDVIDLSGAPDGAPLWSYSSRTYTGSSPLGDTVLIPVWGEITSITVTPTVPYTGASSIHFMVIDAFVTYLNSATYTVRTATINPAIGGTRVITPTSVSGAQAGDNIPLGGAGVWLIDHQYGPGFLSVPSDIGAASVTITIQCDQGVVVPS